MLVHIIPDLLSVKVREMFLRNKAGELDRELGMMKIAVSFSVSLLDVDLVTEFVLSF